MKFNFKSKTLQKAKKTNKLSQLVILVTFLITFVFIRVVVYLQKLKIIPNQNGPLHIHHLVFGIIFVLISGYLGLSFWSNSKVRFYSSILFGIGAALTIDEFALWLFLKDVYFAKQGRVSVDAVIVTITILTLGYVISAIHNHSLFKQIIKNKS